MISPLPAKAAALNADGTLSSAYIEFLSEVFLGLAAVQSSGTTVDRPTKNLFVGRTYFDTSLGANGKPIWISKNGYSWVDASGVIV